MRTVLVAGILFLATPACAMTLSSADFADGEMIPLAHHYTNCEGQNVSPALKWGKPRVPAKSFVLTMIDIDVRPTQWSHWIVVDLPPDTTELPRGFAELPKGAYAVVSNFGDAGYDGPCPPGGSGTHHYRFTIWAMSRPSTALPANAKAMAVQAILEQFAVDKASITGWVRR